MKTMKKDDYALNVYNVSNEISVYLFSINELNNYFDEIKKSMDTDFLVDINYFNSFHNSCISNRYKNYDCLVHNQKMTLHHLRGALKLLENDLKECIELNLVLLRIKKSYKTRMRK